MDELVQFLRAGHERGYIDMRRRRLDLDAPRPTVFRLLRRAGWAQVHRGLWVPNPEGTAHAMRCKLALEHLGDAAYITGASDLYLRGVISSPPEAVELLRPADRWLRPRPGLCIHYARDFETVRYLTVQGVRVTWAARSVREHSRHTESTHLVRTAADAIQARLCTVGQLEDEVASGRFPGCGVLGPAVRALRGEHSHSGYERLARRLLRDVGIVVAGKPLPVLAGTVEVAEVDLPFFEVSYGVEVDGPHHLLAEQAEKDRARDRMLRRDHGIEIDRYFWFQLDEDPKRFVREVTARLRALGYRMP